MPIGIVDGTIFDDLIALGFTDGDGDQVTNGSEEIRAYGGNDTIDGGGGHDTVDGGTGNDLIFGGSGLDIIYGGTGNDQIFGGTGSDQITGDDGNDTISGGPGDDFITAGVGNDTLGGDAGDDVFYINDEGDGIDNHVVVGGETDENGGGDVLDASDITDDLTLSFIAPEEGTLTDGTDTTQFDEIEQFVLGSGDDTVAGSTGNDNVDAGDGDNSISGGDGDDSLTAGNGDDTISAGIGNDTVTTGGGNDTVNGGDGNNVVNTAGANPRPDIDYPGLYSADTYPNNDRDVVTTGSGNDDITTGDDADTISSGDGNDTVNAGLDDDVIDAGRGADVVTAGEGNDFVLGGFGNDVIYGGLGPGFPDAINIADDGSDPFGPDLRPNNNKDTIDGGRGNDLIFGEDDDDILIGGNGADTIYGGKDDDTIDGGIGQDDLIGGQGADSIFGGADRDEFFIDAREDAFGDTVDGGTDGNDVDRLGLTGLGRLEIVGETVDADGDSTSGTVNFLDDAGNVEGTLIFREIERLIVPSNNDPIANDDTVPTDEDTSVIFDPTSNDSDLDGDPLEVTAIGNPANGTIIDNGNGTFTYTPDPDFNGTDMATYTIDDGNGGTATGTITFNVASVNDDPVAEDDSYSVSRLGTLALAASDLLTNDSDVDGDTLSIESIGAASNGYAFLGINGTVYYFANGNFTGADAFSYTVADSNGGTDTAMVTINVIPETGLLTPTDKKLLKVKGTRDDDLILGNGNDNNLKGKQGDDLIFGLDGDDKINGDNGDDFLNGGDGADTIKGGNGDDTIIGGSGNDLLDGKNGADTFIFFGDVGHDEIKNLDLAEGDTIEIEAALAFDEFGTLQVTITQAGDDLVINLIGENSIRLTGDDFDGLTIGDLMFL